ncbi:MAG TPA: methyl-accepting chemotaxis protein [Gemmatimonadales bacterium]|nr:methyl-accepting chemotaxis protein [Gemmatimonadales bacterium]
MFSNLRFAQKIGLLPLAAGAGFLTILVISALLGSRSASRLELIRAGYVPSLEVSRDLEGMLGDLQRTLQDAVAARDSEMFNAAEDLRGRFLARLQTARTNPVLAKADLDQLEQQFIGYYGIARSTAGDMLTGASGDRLTAALQEMSTRYNEIHQRLADQTTHDRTEMEAGFAMARSAQRLATLATVAVTVAGLAFLIFLALVILRGLGRSLQEFSEGFARVSGGNFTQKLPALSRDEFGDLSRQANTMMDGLSELVGAVLKTAGTVAQVAEELSAAATQMQKGAEHQSSSSEQTSAAMVEMATQIDQVARASHDLAATVDETASAIQELGASSDQVAKNSESLVTSVEETAATIQQMTASIESIASKVRVVDEVSRTAAVTVRSRGDELGQVIRGIGASSRDIGKIVGIIEEIADQTNLLALNAAIEAARAGDVGRGFAVVAEEVRRLAERSVESIREIGKVVEGVQRDTTHAVDLTRAVLDEIGSSVDKTSGLVTEVHTSTEEQSRGISQIVSTTSHIQDITQELAHAVREQANGNKSIMSAVENMNRMTQQVAGATREQKRGGDMVVKATEEITDVARQNLTTSGQLASTTSALVREAEALRQVTRRFAA